MLKVQVLFIVAFIAVSLSVTTAQFWCNETWGCTAANTKCMMLQPCKRGDSCVCIDGYVLNSTGNCVLATNKTIGQNCSYDNECMPLQSYCSPVTGKCTCQTNHTASSDNTKCLKNKLGAACINSFDSCGVKAECSNNICKCPSGYKSADGTNCTHYQPGDVCSITDCEDGGCQGGSCTSGIYQCLPGLKWHLSAKIDQLVDGQCVSDMAQTGVGLGYYCDSRNSDYYYCSTNMICESCPEDPNTNRCLSLTGGSSIFSSSFLYIFSAVLLVECFN